MKAANHSSDHGNIDPKLTEMVRNLPEDRQMILLKQLLKGNLAGTLLTLIRDMSADQQAHLLEQLQESPAKSLNFDETEISLRGHSRKSCMIHTNYTVEGRSFESFMLDISPAGAFIETHEPFAAGEPIKLVFSLPDNPKPIAASGEILWKGLLGIGVKFDELPPDQIERIHAFMEEEEEI
jgi:Tfp pilus assembly protein PilZ